MAAKVTIATFDHTLDLDAAWPITISLVPNGRSRFTFHCVPNYTPARFAEVVCYAKDGTTPIFGGLLLQRHVEGFGFGSVPSVCEVECVDFSAYLDWCFVTLTYTTDPTLQDVLDDLVAALPAGYGPITLDATDYSGVTLAAFTWTNKRASDALRELCDRTGLVVTVSPLKVLGLAALGATPAPPVGGITDAVPNCRELTWEDAPTPPITTVKLLCGTGFVDRTETWTANGSDRSWAFPCPLMVRWYAVYVDSALFIIPETGVGATLTIDFAIATITQNVGETTYVNGTVITGLFTEIFPFLVTSTSGASPEIQEVRERPDVFEVAQGQEIADGLRAQLGGSPRTLHITSLDDGWAPGQSLVVDLTGRDVDATCLVTEVDITLVSASFWTYDVTAVTP